MVVEHAVTIERPLEKVWAVFDDPTLQPEWQEGLIALEPVTGEGNEQGAVSKLTFRRGKGEQELIATVIDRSPPTLLEVRYEGMQLPFTLTHEFTAIDDTSCSWRAEIDVRLSLLTKAAGPMIKGPMTEMAEQMGDGFKAYCESR